MRHGRQKGDGEEGDIKGQTKALMKERRGHRRREDPTWRR